MINAENTSPVATLPPETQIQTHTDLERKLHLAQFYSMKGLAILLTLQGLWSLFSSIKFIFIDLPSLENQLALGQITSNQINVFANKAIVMTISTILSLFFALRITVVQSKVAKTISTLIAILLIVGNSQINSFLNQLDSSQLLTSALVETFKSILSF